MNALEACRVQYEVDLAAQTRCCVLQTLTEAHKTSNRTVFEQLVEYQRSIQLHGTLPFTPDSEARRKQYKDAANGIRYPENMMVRSPRELQQILPIPDIHKVSDCDVIYRFLIARRMNATLATQDILHYVAFREKYNLNHILWDREVESIWNGLDGEELLTETMRAIDDEKTKKRSSSKVKPSRLLLQPSWSASNCGVDRWGHVVYFQRPSPKDLAPLVKRYPYVEGAYDHRNPDFHAVTPPRANLLVRLYMRSMEKGRRLSRLLNYQRQHVLRETLGIRLDESPSTLPDSACPSGFTDQGDGITCLIDVGQVKMRYITSSKYRDAFRLFQLVSIMGQNYLPENMCRTIIINGGFIFNVIYKLVKPWLDEQTRKKLILLSQTNSQEVDPSSSVSPLSPSMDSHAPTDENSDDESTSEADNNNNSSANFALRLALEKYIDTKFIPSWYGGKLAVVDAAYYYGDGGPPKALTQNPHFEEALKLIQGKTVPELVSDSWLLQHAPEGEPVCEAEWKQFGELMARKHTSNRKPHSATPAENEHVNSAVA
jgi:hypothetical protein